MILKAFPLILPESHSLISSLDSLTRGKCYFTEDGGICQEVLMSEKVRKNDFERKKLEWITG